MLPVAFRAVNVPWARRPLWSITKPPINQMKPCEKYRTSGFHTLTTPTTKQTLSLSTNPAILSLLQQQPTRNVTKFSINKGKRKTVGAVLKRFKRLDWGGWIRTRCGRHKKMWKKSAPLRNRLRQHVLVNSTQSWLLDKMVTKYWRRPKYYIDDPYKPYHKRESFFATRTKPTVYD